MPARIPEFGTARIRAAVLGSRFGVWGLLFRVWGLGLRVSGLRV